jgi:hypothetical protein
MKIYEVIKEDGIIVKGVNTTVDVKPGETERQAKKYFGGDGKPKHLGVKGATPNQAFNLGLTEGYKLQLERGSDMDVLHITDTDTGQRTEVRGKAGYESGNYDANDRLHMLLDRVGKAANISELMNGEVVGINPKHPDGDTAKAHTDVAFNEKKNTGIFQSAALKVLDNIASRRDGVAHPVKFYDGSSIKVQPKTARKFIDFYDDAEEEQKRWILNYLRTKKGFLELMSPKFVESVTTTLEEAWSAKLAERKLTGGEKRSKEAHVKKLKKHKADFVDRYGKDAESVMYAVATKRAKKGK